MNNYIEDNMGDDEDDTEVSQEWLEQLEWEKHKEESCSGNWDWE